MIKIISASFKVIDQIVSQFFLKLFSEKPALMTFIFHGLFRDEKEIGLNTVDPQQGVTIDHFRQFVEYFLNHDYLFVSPEDILGGLNNNSKYVLITFDDGYYNNIQSLTVLNKYKIPAVFFISANNVKFNKCFWWDVLYRERIRLGVLSKDIVREREWLTSKTNKEIEKYLMNLFGENAFEPRSDIDRPFTPSELKNFSKEEYVFLGNHTCDHAVLTNYSPCGINSQIIDAQNTIYDMTGIMPIIISYPNGNYSKEVVEIAEKNGLKIGVTTVQRKNYLPIDFQSGVSMRIGRFTLWGNGGLIEQCKMFRSDIALYPIIRKLFKKKLSILPEKF